MSFEHNTCRAVVYITSSLHVNDDDAMITETFAPVTLKLSEHDSCLGRFVSVGFCQPLSNKSTNNLFSQLLP